MKQGNGLPVWIQEFSLTGLLLLAGSVAGWTQESTPIVSSSPSDSTAAAIHELQQQVNELRAAMAEMRSEAAEYRAENSALRRELQATRLQSEAVAIPPASSYGSSAADTERASPTEPAPPVAKQASSLEDRIASLEDSTQLLNSKLDDQYQTKVESASKYRVRLSGIVLMNLFSNRGTTDMQDIPSYVTGPNQGNGDFGATLRQSEIGLEVFGPTLAGAKTSGKVQADFAGGFPGTWNGVNSGIFRLRIASARMDWENTSLVMGQDSLFLSPNSPTSFASLAVPALNYAGNLWSWTPQVMVEHRFKIADDQKITMQAGIFDNLAGEFPADPYFRSPGPGESSGQPAYGLRTAWTKNVFGLPLTLGVAGYYSRQDWGFDHYADGWAGMADWAIPLSPRISFSGEFYRGRAIGGLNGGISRSVIFNGDPTMASTSVTPLDSIGGWSGFKIRATSRLEFNTAFGLDNPKASEVRAGEGSEAYVGALLVQNRGALANFIFRPRSNLLFSAEYRHLQSFQVYDTNNSAQQFNLMMGILF